MTQEQKQAIWVAGWLLDRQIFVRKFIKSGWSLNHYTVWKSDAELIQYAKEKGMELPAELDTKETTK
jgi:hypothetical protein